jgi:hypothetical protein
MKNCRIVALTTTTTHPTTLYHNQEMSVHRTQASTVASPTEADEKPKPGNRGTSIGLLGEGDLQCSTKRLS